MSYTFPYDRLKLLIFALGGIVAATAVVFLLSFIGRGEAAQAAAHGAASTLGAAAAVSAGVVLFGGAAATAVRFLLREGSVLTVDEHGILDRRRGRRIPWAGIRAVHAEGRGWGTTLAVAVDPPERFERRSLPLRLLTLPLRRREHGVVTLNVGALACRLEDVALAIEACGGVPVQRRAS